MMNLGKRYLTLGIGVGFVLASMIMVALAPERKAVQPAPVEMALAPRGTPQQPSPLPQVKVIRQFHVYIPVNVTAGEIAGMLKTAGVLGDTKEFLRKVGEYGAASRLNYGLFEFQEGESLDSIINKLTGG